MILISAIIAQAIEKKIVVFDSAVNVPARQALIEAVGGIIIKNLLLINGKAVLLPPRAEAVLDKMTGIKRIDPDVIVEALAQTLPWEVNRVDADLAWNTSIGSRVKVAIVDTGISTKHPDPKVWAGVNNIASRKNYNYNMVMGC